MSQYSAMLLPLSIPCLVFVGACISCIVAAIRELINREESGVALFIVTLTAVLAAALVCIAAPESASDLSIEDAVEYALSAERLVTDGQYLLTVDGKEYPPRFSPTFSAFLLAPLGAIFSNLTGSFISGAVYGCAFLAIVGAVAASLSAYLMANVWAALFAIGLIVILPEVRYFGQMAMSDVPFSAVLILIFLQMLLLQVRADRRGGWSLLGILIACAATIRPFGALALVPAVGHCWKHRCGSSSKSTALKNISMITIPSAALGTAVLWYNYHVFGDPFRSGYHYWMAVPYDYRSLLVSTGYVIDNLIVLIETTAVIPVMLLGIAGWVYFRREKNNRIFLLQARLCRIWVIAFVLVAFPIIAFHLFYFYSSGRFYLPVTLLAALPAVAVVGSCLSSKQKTGRVAIGALLVILIAVCFRLTSSPQNIGQHAVVQQWRQVLPPNALLFSDRNSAYLERFLVRRTLRKVVPWSREGTYASKVVTATRIPMPSPPPSDWSDHRAVGLRAAGAIDVYPVVGSELSSEGIEDALSGRPVFFESELLSDALRSQLAKFGRLADRGDGLYELQAYAQEGAL